MKFLPQTPFNYAIAVAGTMLLAALLMRMSGTTISANDQQNTSSPIRETPFQVPATPSESTLKNNQQISDKPPQKNLNSATLAEEKHKAWAMGSTKAAPPSMPLNEKIIAYEAVEIDPHPTSFPEPGEQITLPMLHDNQVVVDVQSSTINPNGDHTWSGHVQGFGTDYPVIMTYGEHGVFAMITTPEGSYSMESIDGSGWLYKNPSELELTTPGTKDYIEINAADLNRLQ